MWSQVELFRQSHTCRQPYPYVPGGHSMCRITLWWTHLTHNSVTQHQINTYSVHSDVPWNRYDTYTDQRYDRNPLRSHTDTPERNLYRKNPTDNLHSQHAQHIRHWNTASLFSLFSRHFLSSCTSEFQKCDVSVFVLQYTHAAYSKDPSSRPYTYTRRRKHYRTLRYDSYTCGHSPDPTDPVDMLHIQTHI